MTAGNIVMDQLGLFDGKYGRVVLGCRFDSEVCKSLKKLFAAGWHDGFWSPKLR